VVQRGPRTVARCDTPLIRSFSSCPGDRSKKSQKSHHHKPDRQALALTHMRPSVLCRPGTASGQADQDSLLRSPGIEMSCAWPTSSRPRTNPQLLFTSSRRRPRCYSWPRSQTLWWSFAPPTTPFELDVAHSRFQLLITKPLHSARSRGRRLAAVPTWPRCLSRIANRPRRVPAIDPGTAKVKDRKELQHQRGKPSTF